FGRYNDTINGKTRIFFSFDEITARGGNTWDACALFDAGIDGNADYAFCMSLDAGANNAPKFAAGYPKLYQCDNSLPQNCGKASEVSMPASFKWGDLISLNPNADLTTATDPFVNDDSYPDDTTVAVEWANIDITAKLVNVCTYPSASPTSNASDCI